MHDPLDSLLARRDALLLRLAEKPDDDPLQAEWRGLKSDIEAARGALARRLVDGIRIAAPCPADWASMTGGERVRHCGKCEKNVYSVDGLSAVEVATLMMEHESSLCLRLFRRKDGTVLTADCDVGVRRRRRRLRVVGAVAGAVVAGAGALAFGVASSIVADGQALAEARETLLDEPSQEPFDDDLTIPYSGGASYFDPAEMMRVKKLFREIADRGGYDELNFGAAAQAPTDDGASE